MTTSELVWGHILNYGVINAIIIDDKYVNMTDLDDIQQDDVNFVEEYYRKIHSFEWSVDADKASKAFLDNSFSPLHTVGTELQKAMQKYRFAIRDIELGAADPDDVELDGHAYHARLCIEDALDRGIIIQGDGLTGKLDDAKKKIQELEREKTSLENQNIILFKKNEELEKEKKSYKKLGK